MHKAHGLHILHTHTRRRNVRTHRDRRRYLKYELDNALQASRHACDDLGDGKQGRHVAVVAARVVLAVCL